MPSVHTVRHLIRDIGDEATPTHEEQVAWARTIRDPATSPEDREAAIREMVRRNLPLVILVARKSAWPNEDIGDLVSYGTMGLRRAVERYNPDYGTRFSTFAVHWIKQRIQRGRVAASDNRPYTIPIYLHSRKQQAAKLRAELADRGETISLADAARRLGFTGEAPYIDRVDALLVQGTHGEGDNDVDLEAFPAPGPAGEDHEPGAMTAMVRRFVRRLPPNEKRVIRLYYGMDPLPGRDDSKGRVASQPGGLIARHLGISRERVRQIRQSALAKLRKWAEEEGCS